VLVVLGKLVEIARPIGHAAHARLFHEADSDFGAFVFSAMVLLAIAFVAGLFARSRPGRRIFGWLETRILLPLPPYTLLRQTIHDMAGSTARLAGTTQSEVVLARFDDQTSLGFLIERRPDGQVVVYLPGAPNALSGSVVLMEATRITTTKLTPAEVLAGMRRLGAGLQGLGEK
jgi:uncharacterized membrane protein